MITISVRVCEDAWSNPDQVQAELTPLDPTVPVALDFHADGVSMQAVAYRNKQHLNRMIYDSTNF